MPNHTIFLASKSPRRRELLTRLGYEVRVIASHTHTLGAFEGGFNDSTFDYRLSHSTVTFRTLTDLEIERYANSGEPYDKAGGYGIQGTASIFISHIAGSYTGIMGLPVFETAELLSEAGFPVLG